MAILEPVVRWFNKLLGRPTFSEHPLIYVKVDASSSNVASSIVLAGGKSGLIAHASKTGDLNFSASKEHSQPKQQVEVCRIYYIS